MVYGVGRQRGVRTAVRKEWKEAHDRHPLCRRRNSHTIANQESEASPRQPSHSLTTARRLTRISGRSTFLHTVNHYLLFIYFML